MNELSSPHCRDAVRMLSVPWEVVQDSGQHSVLPQELHPFPGFKLLVTHPRPAGGRKEDTQEGPLSHPPRTQPGGHVIHCCSHPSSLTLLTSFTSDCSGAWGVLSLFGLV